MKVIIYSLLVLIIITFLGWMDDVPNILRTKWASRKTVYALIAVVTCLAALYYDGFGALRTLILTGFFIGVCVVLASLRRLVVYGMLVGCTLLACVQFTLGMGSFLGHTLAFVIMLGSVLCIRDLFLTE